MDVGGALLYRGTGVEKKDKFGDKVTELEGLRNLDLNPISATVYGDMTMKEIKDSAKPVLAISDADIQKAADARFVGENEVAKILANRLIARRDYIKKWIEDNGKDTKSSEVPEQKKYDEGAIEAAIKTGMDYAKKGLITGAEDYASKVEELGGNASEIHNTLSVSLGQNEPNTFSNLAVEDASKLDAFSQSWKKTKAYAIKLASQGEVEAAEIVLEKMEVYAKKKFVTKSLMDPVKAAIQKAKQKDSEIPSDNQNDIPDSGYAATQAAVQTGEISKPEPGAEPEALVLEQQEHKAASGGKNWGKDLEQVEGQKGSSYGGLYKDKVLGSLHYVKWPGEDRSKMEALAVNLYARAGVYVPMVRAVKFPSGKADIADTAVVSDWLPESKAMTTSAIGKHPDVREGFLVDAWLANWDVVGLSGDNIVQGSGNSAFRIDAGGALVYRAQGKPKAFSVDAPEFHTMRNPSTNPQAATAFANLTVDELSKGIDKLGSVTDADIAQAMEAIALEGNPPNVVTSLNDTDAFPHYADWLQHRLIKRRDAVLALAKEEVMQKQGTIPEKKVPSAPAVQEQPKETPSNSLDEAKKQAIEAGDPYMFLSKHKDIYYYVKNGHLKSYSNASIIVDDAKSLAKSLANKGYWKQANFILVAIKDAGYPVPTDVKNAVAKSKGSAGGAHPTTLLAKSDNDDGGPVMSPKEVYDQAVDDVTDAGQPTIFLNKHKQAYSYAINGHISNGKAPAWVLKEAPGLAKILANKGYTKQAYMVVSALLAAGEEIPPPVAKAVEKAMGGGSVTAPKKASKPVDLSTLGGGLNDDTNQFVLSKLKDIDFYQASATLTQKQARIELMEGVAEREGVKKPSATALRAAYRSWKGSSTTTRAQILRWAISELGGKGDAELDNTEALIKKTYGKNYSQEVSDKLRQDTKIASGQNILRGADLSRKINEVIHKHKRNGAEYVKVYRGFQGNQLQHMEVPSGMDVGDELTFKRLPALSWTFSPNVKFGIMRVEAMVPISSIVVSDRVNNDGNHPNEDEVVFRAENLDAKIIWKDGKW